MLEMEGDFIDGQLLLLKTLEGDVRGHFHSMNDDGTVITLKNVIKLSQGTAVKTDGILHLHKSEIISIKMLEPDSGAGLVKGTETTCNHKFMRIISDAHHRSRDVVTVMDFEVVANYNPYHLTGFPNPRRSVKRPAQKINRTYAIAHQYLYVEDMESLGILKTYLETENIIALEFEGSLFGWWQKIGLINIATWNKTFLIDLKAVGDTAFIEWLKNILESTEIIKVIHNCRLISAILFHEYNIVLTNIFDTQVADLCFVLQNYGKLPFVTRSLPDCLAVYLNLSDSMIHRLKARDGYLEVDLLPWTQRPLHLLQQQAAVKNGTFLLHLHRKLIPINRAAFEYGCKTYLNILRKSSAEDIPLYFPQMFLLPREMLKLNKFS